MNGKKIKFSVIILILFFQFLIPLTVFARDIGAESEIKATPLKKGEGGICKIDDDCLVNFKCISFPDETPPTSKCERFVEPPPTELETKLTEDINDRLQISIPGLNFSKLTSTIDSEGYIYIPWIGEYIQAIYNYALGIISIVAVIMIIVQGAKIVVSGGGQMKSEGLKKIGHVAIGLVIAWSSYAILYSINPTLVTFKPLKLLYVKPIEISTEGEPDTIPAASQNLVTIATPDFNKCQLEKFKTFSTTNNLFDTKAGQCLRWVKQSWGNACSGEIPEALNNVGAWDVAVTFKRNGRFHACNLDGIQNGDIVFMTSIGSNYIGLWDNFRNGPDGCTIADSAAKPRYLKNNIILPYTGSLNITTGMPPVTHIGVYFDGIVYHQVGKISDDPTDDIKAHANLTSKNALWTLMDAELNGNFYHSNAEFIAGYGFWR